jgi:hypothetical protein
MKDGRVIENSVLSIQAPKPSNHHQHQHQHQHQPLEQEMLESATTTIEKSNHNHFQTKYEIIIYNQNTVEYLTVSALIVKVNDYSIIIQIEIYKRQIKLLQQACYTI